MRPSRSSASPRARRRRRLLGWLALAALAGGLVVGATGAGSEGPAANGGAGAPGDPQQSSALEQARSRVAGMSLERQVGELMVIAFREPAAVPHWVLRALREGRAAGVILFRGNAASASAVRATTARVQRAAADPAIVCLDQEGGDIRTLAFAPSAQGQARQRTSAAAGAAATATARALRSVGVNVVLGPVADVAAGTPGSIMASRAYPGGSAAVAAAVRAAAGAYERAGIVPVLKHFPGLGGAHVNTDDGTAVIPRTVPQSEADLLPYLRTLGRAPTGAASTGGLAPLVMVSHARYPQLDRHRIASQSRTIVSGLLHGQLGFDGVAMTDSLEAEAVHRASPDVGTAGVRSIDAGVDLLLLTGPGSFLPVQNALLAQAHRSATFRARIAEAAARVLALRRTLRTAPA